MYKNIFILTIFFFSYMNAARVGDVLSIKSDCLKVGRTLAFATVDIINQHGKMVAQGKHSKFIANRTD